MECDVDCALIKYECGMLHFRGVIWGSHEYVRGRCNYPWTYTPVMYRIVRIVRKYNNTIIERPWVQGSLGGPF